MNKSLVLRPNLLKYFTALHHEKMYFIKIYFIKKCVDKLMY